MRSEFPVQIECETDVRNLVAETIPQLVFRLRHDGHWTWCGAQWIEYTGLGLEESLGLGWLKAVHPSDQGAAVANWGVAESCNVHSMQLRIWSRTETAFRWHLICGRPVLTADDSTSWVGAMTDVDALVDQQIRQDVMITELQHRARNLLGVTWAIASKIIRKTKSISEFKLEFRRRIGALGRVQALLDGGEVGLRKLLSSQLAALAGDDPGTSAVTIDGPPVMLSPKAAQTLGLAVYELATNAVKYGAFATPNGRLEVAWVLDSSNDPKVTLTWKEFGVQMQPAAGRTAGYGTELLTRALPFDLGAKTELTFEADGLRCVISIPLARLGGRLNEARLSGMPGDAAKEDRGEVL